MIYKHIAFAYGSEDGVFTDGNGEIITGINKVSPYRYASLEPDTYNLDEPRPFYAGQQLGYFSGVLSNEEGMFEEPLIINIDFPQLIQFSGITFEADLLMEAEITTYFNDDVVENLIMTLENNNGITTYTSEINKVQIKINYISEPNRFLNIFGIRFGRVYIINDFIKSIKAVNNVSVSGRELPIDTLSITATGLPEDLVLDTEQKIEILRENGSIEQVFYLNTFETKDEVTTLSYVDCAGLLEDEFKGDYYKNVTVKSIGDDIMQDTGISYDFNAFAGTRVNGYIPVTTKRNALIYIANAVGLQIEKHPVLRFTKPENNNLISKSFNDENIFENSYSVTEDVPAKEVKLAIFSNKPIKEEEYDVVYEEELEAGEYEIELDTPIYTEGLKVSNCIIATDENEKNVQVSDVVFTANFVSFSIPKKCTVKIQFIKFWDFDTYIEKSKQIPNASLYKNKTIETIDSFTLMANDDIYNWQSRLDELFNYYTVNKKIKFKGVWEKISPYGRIKVYSDTCRITKLSHSFDDVVEVEAEKIVD